VSLSTTERCSVFHEVRISNLIQQSCPLAQDFVFLRSVRRLLVTANVAISPILVTLMMEALRSSETSVLTRATRRNIPEDDILHSHRRENLKSYIHWTALPVDKRQGPYFVACAALLAGRSLPPPPRKTVCYLLKAE
jgi:hypothetical protein